MNRRLAAGFLFAVLTAAFPLAAQTGHDAPEKTVQRIQREVRHEILMLPYFDVFDNITYKVEGYVVTLGVR